MDKPPITLGELLAAAQGRWTTFPGFKGSDKFTFHFNTATARKKFLDAFKGSPISGIPGWPSGQLLHKSSWKDRDLFWLSLSVRSEHTDEARQAVITKCNAPIGYSTLYLATMLVAKGMEDYTEEKTQDLIDQLIAEGVVEPNPHGNTGCLYRLPIRRTTDIADAREEILRYLTGLPYGWNWQYIKNHLDDKGIKISNLGCKDLLARLVSEGILEINPNATAQVYRYKDIAVRQDHETRRRYYG